MNRILTVTKISIGTLVLLSSCVPTKKFKASQAALQSARNDSASLARNVSDLKHQVADQQKTIESKTKNISDLEQQIDKLSKDISDLNQERVKLINDASSKQS